MFRRKKQNPKVAKSICNGTDQVLLQKQMEITEVQDNDTMEVTLTEANIQQF
jgi:hypothetical protein